MIVFVMDEGKMSTKTTVLMFIGSFIAMFITMYAMGAVWDHVYININKIYMAGLMAASMGIIQIAVMGFMYSKKMRFIVLGSSIALVTLLFIFIRQQTGVNNVRFLRSMIPHHSSAILMCNEANITDPDIKELCAGIVKTQRQEISIMKKLLENSYN